jgi:predicted restriction endonuclease
VGVALRASHIRPWKSSNNEDRLDAENGLLLVATLDALFDRGWISFRDDGSILISTSITQAEQERIGLIGLRIRKPLTPKQKAHLDHHRTERYDKHRQV